MKKLYKILLPFVGIFLLIWFPFKIFTAIWIAIKYSIVAAGIYLLIALCIGLVILFIYKHKS